MSDPDGANIASVLDAFDELSKLALRDVADTAVRGSGGRAGRRRTHTRGRGVSRARLPTPARKPAAAAAGARGSPGVKHAET